MAFRCMVCLRTCHLQVCFLPLLLLHIVPHELNGQVLVQDVPEDPPPALPEPGRRDDVRVGPEARGPEGPRQQERKR